MNVYCAKNEKRLTIDFNDVKNPAVFVRRKKVIGKFYLVSIQIARVGIGINDDL